MIKIKLLTSGEVITVTQNVGYGLIDSGQAKLYTGKPVAEKQKSRMMTAETKRRYKTK